MSDIIATKTAKLQSKYAKNPKKAYLRRIKQLTTIDSNNSFPKVSFPKNLELSISILKKKMANSPKRIYQRQLNNLLTQISN